MSYRATIKELIEKPGDCHFCGDLVDLESDFKNKYNGDVYCWSCGISLKSASIPHISLNFDKMKRLLKELHEQLELQK